MLSALLLIVLATEASVLVMWGISIQRDSGSIGLAIALPLITAAAWRALIVVVSFVLAGVHRRSEVGSRSARAIAVFSETMLTLWLYSFSHPFVAFFRPRPQGKDGPVIILVHGFLCNGGMWTALARFLRRHGFGRIYAVDLNPFYFDMQQSLARFHAEVNRILAAEQATEAVLIGHSMGGVLARMYRYLHPTRVRLAILIGAPHAGTELARWVGAGERGPVTPRTRWLRALNQPCAERAVDSDVINIWSEADNIVFPQINAHLPDAIEHRLNTLGHLRLSRHPQTFALILSALQQLSATSDAPCS